MKYESVRKRSHEQQTAREILRRSPTVRMLAARAGRYGPQPTARQLAPTDAADGDLAERQVLFAEATPGQTQASDRYSVERREALLDDALDDSFPASDPPAIVASVYGGWR